MGNEADMDTEQAELMTGLLEGEDPGLYVVMPIGALVTQIRIALAETTHPRTKQLRPGLACARLARNLGTLGFTRNTKFEKAEPDLFDGDRS